MNNGEELCNSVKAICRISGTLLEEFVADETCGRMPKRKAARVVIQASGVIWEDNVDPTSRVIQISNIQSDLYRARARGAVTAT